MKPVLIAYASRKGSTQEIASVIGDRLVSRRFEVEVATAVDAPRTRGFGAVLLGSAAYMGQWDKHALDYLRREATDLALRPTWLFQSGRAGTPRAVRRLCRTIGIAEPTIFSGNVDPGGATEAHAPALGSRDVSGDDRDRILAWADDIADQLTAIQTPTGV